MGLFSRRILKWQVNLYLDGVEATAHLNVPRFSEPKVSFYGMVGPLEQSQDRDEEREVGVALAALQEKLSLAKVEADPLLSKCILAARNGQAITIILSTAGKLRRIESTNRLLRTIGLEGTMVGVDAAKFCAVDDWADKQIG